MYILSILLTVEMAKQKEKYDLQKKRKKGVNYSITSVLTKE